MPPTHSEIMAALAAFPAARALFLAEADPGTVLGALAAERATPAHHQAARTILARVYGPL